MSGTFPHDSLFGGLNLTKKRSGRAFLQVGERPPYPIINDNPTTLDVVHNLNRADLGLFLAFALIGFPVARCVIRAPMASEFQRRSIFNLTWTMSMTFGGYFALANSFYRLRGFIENGLRWKRRDRKLNKYDFSKDFESKTIFKHFRLRD